MSAVLRLGAVKGNDFGNYQDSTTCFDSDVVDIPSAPSNYCHAPVQTYPGCFGLPYQDHNYGAPPPITPPASPPPPPQPPVVEPPVVVTTEKVNGHIEVDEVPVPAVAATEVAKEISVEDDSVTRCICDYIHDDGYMICCDKCSVWQHIDCMAVDRNNIPESYYCEICEPRPVDKERAYQLQTKRKELLITDSSATDTDPEEAMNRQMSQQQQLANKKGKSKKKTKVKPDKVQASPVKNSEVKQRKSRREKKDVKKEKENKEADKKQKTAIKEAISKKINKSKLNKKPGLSLVVNENAQDPWDSSYSPWVDKYEEAKVNHYSADIVALMSVRINGQNVNGPKPKNSNLLVQRCHVTEVSKNRKGLEASETIGEGEPIIEYTGKVMLKQQFDRDNFFKQFNPFVLFYNKYDNLEICVDATSFGNTARFIRRSCKANAEVQHVFENGEMYFYVYSAKVIPRGSEITIPYDYNYKDCTYCVECACLRNNCPVAKYFKKRQNAQNKKEKAPPKPPKSPGKPVSKSPVKSPTKSPFKKNIEFPKGEAIVKTEIEDKVVNQPEALPTPEIVPPDASSPKEEPVSKKTEVKVVKEEDNNSNSCMDVETNSDADEGSSGAMPAASSEKSHKMTREERKMEAIMKAFEKLEKREERRKEALARMDHKVECKTQPETATSPDAAETPAPEKKTVKIEEPVKEVPAPTPVVKEEPPEVEEQVVNEPVVKRETRPKKKSRKTAARRKSRMSSSCSTETNASLSVDENSNTNLPSGQSTPVPSTPVSADISSPPSFRFLKTKKHLMSEWMNEKSQDTSSISAPIKIQSEPLEVNVEDAMFVTCLPSPRNSMDHLRRNSHSSGGSGGIKVDNSIGSAKKRWLRQAMWDKPIPSNGCTSPVPAGGTSPNPALNNVPSPGASPPGDFVTPLKKRRMARESCDQPVPPTPSTPGLSDVNMSTPDVDRCKVEQDVQGFKPCIFPPTPVTPEDEESNVSKKSDETFSHFKRGRDSLDSEISDMHSARTSIDLSDIEQDKTSQNTGSSSRVITNNLFSEDRIFNNIKSNLLNSSSDSAEVETSSSSVCESEVTKSVKDRDGMNSECDSLQGQRNLADSEMEARRHEVESEAEGDINSKMNKEYEAMEVDSTEGSKTDNKSRTCNKKQTVCDSTSSKLDMQAKSLLVTTDNEQAVIGSSSSCHSHSVSISVSKESTVVVDSSTDSKLLRERVVAMSSEQISVSSADQSIDRNCVSRLDSTAMSVADQSVDKSCVSFSDSAAMSIADQSADRHSVTSLHSTVVSQSADKNLSDSSAELIADQSVDRNCISLSDNFAVSTADQSIDKNNDSLLDSTAMTDADQSGDMSSNCVSVSSEPSASVAIADQSTDRNIDHCRAEMVVDSGQQDPFHSHDQSNESLVESVSDASNHKLVYSTGTGENVGSSSDKKKCLFDVSSSSESRTSESLSVESSQPIESVNVSSTEQLCPTEDVPSTGGVADSSEATSSCKIDEDMSDVASSVTNSLCASSISEADTPSAVHGRLGYEDFKQHEASSSSSSSHSSMSPAVLEESNQASESLPVPVPTKKKVSLLEYRKRLKEKHTTTSSSGSSSQSPIFSSSQTPPPLPSSSFNNIPTHNKPVSSYSNHSPSSRTQSRRLTSLPSLPLFESSPPKDQSSRHQFKSSSDLIRRKSTETKKREKPLSLSERLKLEFGVDDSEEEKESNDGSKSHHLCTSTSRQASSSSISFTTPPPPPPPPPCSTAQSRSCSGSSAGQDRQQEVNSQAIVQPAQGYQQQIYHPQVPPPHIAMHPTMQGDHTQNPMLIRGPSPGLMPTHQTPSGPPLQHNGNPVPNPGMLHPPNVGGQAPQMMNGPGPPPSGPPPSARQAGQIPSLMSLQTFPTLNLQQASNGQTPPTQNPQQTGYQQHDANIDQGQQAMLNQEQSQFNQQHAVHGNGVYPHTPPQQNFTQPPNGTNFNMLQKSPMQVPPYSPQQSNIPPSGGPVVHDYNHGFNGVHCGDAKQRYHNSPSQYHNPIHNQQRKSKKKKKNKGFNHQHQTYPDSGGHY